MGFMKLIGPGEGLLNKGGGSMASNAESGLALTA